jgi:hypothetical protein
VPPFSPEFSQRHVTNALKNKASSHREEDDPSVGGALLSLEAGFPDCVKGLIAKDCALS